jgi:ketosteroid isomerase-like protein
MLLDVRIYRIHAGRRAEFDVLVRHETVPMARRYGQQVLAFGPSAHDDDSYFLIRAFGSPEERTEMLARFYDSEEWRTTYDARVMALIESYQTAVIAATPETVGHLREAGDVDDERAVAALDTEYQAAVERNDAATMDRILADDFVLITGLGRIFTKADLLDEARKRSTVYEYQKDTDQTVRVWGDTAVITALLWAKGSSDGKPFEYRLHFSDTYVRTPAGWRYVLGQASTRMPGQSE